MDTAATPSQEPVDTDAIAGQREHWAAAFEANPDMYGTDPSAPRLPPPRHSRPRATAVCSSSARARDATPSILAMTTVELERLALELRRVLRPGGLVVYTVRTTADAHFGTGTPRGDDMYEHGGFIVHFFDRALIERLAAGFELIDVSDFTEGELPRRLARVTMRVP